MSSLFIMTKIETHTYTPRDVQHRANNEFIFSGSFYNLSE